jgi:hypothetical protein
MNTPPRDEESQPKESQATDIESQTQPVVVLSPNVSPIKTPPTKSPEGVAQYDPSAEKMGVTNVPISQPEENESSEFDDELQGIRERSASQTSFVDDLGTLSPKSSRKGDDESTQSPVEEENVSISSEGQGASVAEEGETDESVSSLIQQYDKVSNELENFFFNRVEGLFEYLLFLILYEQLDILGPDKEKVPLNQEKQTGGQQEKRPGDTLESDESKVQRIEPPDISRIEPVVPTNCNNFKSQTPSVKNILILKLHKELNHDFKGKNSLDDIDDIRETYLEFLESLEDDQNNESDETKLYKSLRESTGEWSFYTSMLEYFIEDCNGFNDLTMIRYKSITNNYTGEKQFLLKDINAPPESVNYVNSFFNGEEFKYRFQDNGTPNEVLKRIVRPNPDQPNPIDNIQVIENAPSLIDPATRFAIPMSKFYPSESNTEFQDFQGFQNFQKSQDLNFFDNEHNNTILEILKGGISQFFRNFGSTIQFSEILRDTYTQKYESSPVRFIVVDGEGNEIRDFERYSLWINRPDQSGNPYFYKGVRITDSSKQSIELHVGDSAIPNICSLVNSNYYLKKNQNRKNPTPTEKSWNRLIDFAKYITTKRDNNSFNLNDEYGLRLVIIALKSFGDSFQVFYSTAIQKETFFPGTANKTYLSSSDKNVGAEKMFYNSPFLLNGCGIQPYQSLRERFAYFFEQDLSVQGMDGDIGDDEDTRSGSSKAILTNIKQENRDYKPMITLVSNNILSILEGEEKPQELIDEIFSQTGEPRVTTAMIEDFANNAIVMEVEGSENISEELYKKIQKIYNSLKLVKQQNNVLDEKIDFLLNSVEEQNELLLKMIARKHEPTTKELEKLNERLTNNETNMLNNSLDKLINVSCLQSSSLQGLQTKMNEFKQGIRDKLQQKKRNLTDFIERKLPRSKNTSFGERASRTAKKFYNGLMDFVSDRKYYEKKLREMAGLELQGGKIKRKIIKTIKHRIKKHKTRRENSKNSKNSNIPKNVTVDKKQNKIHRKTRRQ